MKSNHTTIRKALLAIMPALLLALILQPAAALAHTVTYETMDNAKFECIYDTYATPPTENARVTETVEDGGCPTINNGRYQVDVPDSDYEFAFWLACDGMLVQKDVTLTDDTVLKAGTPLTTEQVQSVAVHDDLTFIAYFGNVWGYDDPPLLDVIFTASNGGSIKDPRIQTIMAGVAPDEVIPEPDQGFEFDYWTADVPVYVYTNYSKGYTGGTWVAAGTHIAGSSPCASVCLPTTFTAHFKATTPTYTVTYTVDDKGVAFDENHNTESVAEGNSPASVPEPVAQDPTKYMFAYWSTDAEVVLSDGTVIDAGAKITTDQLKQVKVTSALTFTATFEQIAVDLTYQPDGKGMVIDKSTGLPTDNSWTERVALNSSHTAHPSGCEAIPDENYGNYVFDYWTASDWVYVDGEGSYKSGTPLTSDQIKLIDLGRIANVYDLTFTAHFAKLHTITYEAGAHGSVSPTTEQVKEGYAPAGPTIVPDANYAFDYWTANKNVEVADADTQAVMLADSNSDVEAQASTTTIDKGEAISTDEFSRIVTSDDVTFTAHFKRTAPYTVTYTTDGNGSVTPETEEVLEGKSPKGPSITPNANFEFDYWTANTEVYYIDDENNIVEFDVDDQISADELKKLSVEEDVVFTAHFKEAPVDPEPEPVDPDDPDNPDGGDTIKPVDGEGGKLVPKTGDTLPGVTAAVALGAGVVVAGVALLKKRYQ